MTEREFALEPDHSTQITPAHVLHALTEFKGEVTGRFDTLEGKVDRLETMVANAGLNGHTPLLKAFLEQYGATYVKRQAWQTVRSDIAHRFRFLRQPRAWLRAIFYASLGGIGWEFASHLSGFHPPHFFGF